MKKTIKISLLLAFLFLGNQLHVLSQSIAPTWYGSLRIQGTSLRLVLHVQNSKGIYSASMDSPDQKAFDIPVTSINIQDSLFKFSIKNLRIEYSGIIQSDSLIKGTFTQAGQSFAMDLTSNELNVPKLKRPQEPKEPFGYSQKEVRFFNSQDSIYLAGTLTIPKGEGKHPAVVLISGSGPQNRDEEILGHKPFWVIADFLTKNGFAVLRFDDRGTEESEGDFYSATSVDFARDVRAAIDFLKTQNEIDTHNLGLIGHSEGGMIAPMLAANDSNLSFLVLLAGTGLPGKDILLLQQGLIAKANGVSKKDRKAAHKTNKEVFAIMQSSQNTNEIRVQLRKYFDKIIDEKAMEKLPQGMSKQVYIGMQLSSLTQPWMLYFLSHDPATVLENVKVPVLALNGSKDLQVPAKENLKAIKKALNKGGNKRVTTKEFPRLNHLFQTSKTGSPSEYESIEETFSPEVLEYMLQWMQANKK